jgi:two-component system, chemotaxis family, chemotaxis protein CheY
MSKHPASVLIADDNHVNREILRAMLHQLTTAEVHMRSDGAAALSAYHELKPQITLLDISMPHMDGFSVLENIRVTDPSAFVIMVSADNELSAVKRAKELGVGGYLVKPYSAQRLLAALMRYVDTSGDEHLLLSRV